MNGENVPKLEIDEQIDAVLSLEFTQGMLARVLGDARYWKWVLIGLHNALQGFMVLALQGTAYFNVLKKEQRAAWIKSLDEGHQYTGPSHLAFFMELYRDIQSDRMKRYTHSRVFKPTNTQSQSVERLNNLRNDFIHFIPTSWVLYLNGLPELVKDVIDVIEFLAAKSNNISWNDQGIQRQAQELIFQLRAENKKVADQYQV